MCRERQTDIAPLGKANPDTPLIVPLVSDGTPIAELSGPHAVCCGRDRGAPLEDAHDSIHGDVLEHVDPAADPADLDAVDAVVLAQAEVQPRAEVALVAAAAVDLVDLASGRRPTTLTRAPTPSRLVLHALQPDLEPVVAGSAIRCAGSSARARELRIDHVDVAVVVQVVEGGAAAAAPARAGRRRTGPRR